MTGKIWFSEEDLSSMMQSFQEGDMGLWNSWSYQDSEGNMLDIELHLGNEDDS